MPMMIIKVMIPGRRWRPTAGILLRSCRRCQGLLQVVAEVVEVFDADAEADEPVVDPAGLADLGRDAGVRHGGGMADQRLDAAEALGQAEQAGPREEPARGRAAAGEAEADHAAE